MLKNVCLLKECGMKERQRFRVTSYLWNVFGSITRIKGRKKYVQMVFPMFFLTWLVINNFPQLSEADPERNLHQLNALNSLRYREAVEYLHQNGPTFVNSKEQMVNFTGITIMTIQRDNVNSTTKGYFPRYLTQVVAQFVRLLNRDKKLSNYRLYICNVDLDPENYTEIRGIPKWISVFNRFDKTTSEIKSSFRNISVFEKQRQDYVYCLNHTLQQNVTSVLMVEDDALPLSDLFPVLEHVTGIVLEKIYGQHDFKENILFLKLYHPEWLLGYIGSGLDRYAELVSLSTLFATLEILICRWRYSRITPEFMPQKLWLYLIFLNCLVFLTIGRVNIVELRRFSKYLYQITPAPSCCLPAMFYPKEGAITLVDLLSTMTCNEDYPVDTAIDDLRTKTELVGKMILPNLFQHIGYFSSVRSEFVDPNALN